MQLAKQKKGKSPGIDNITAELFKAGVKSSSNKIKELSSNIWNNKQIPSNWKKRPDDQSTKERKSKRMQKLKTDQFTTVMSKLLGRILIDKITDDIDDKLRKEKAGFRSGRGTTEPIIILRKIIEQVNE